MKIQVIKQILGGLLYFALMSGNALQAETMIEMPLDRIVKSSDLVIHGTIVSAKSRWGDRKHSVIWTDYAVKVDDILHGKASGETVIVTQQGGALEGTIMQVGSNPQLEVGDEVIVALAKADFLEGMARGDAKPKYTIVGVAQGTYYIVRGGDTTVAFKDYARVAVLPRPRARPTKEQPSVADSHRDQLERLKEAVRKNPNDRDLARRLAEAERLLSAAPPPVKRKPHTPSETKNTRTKPDLGLKPEPNVTEKTKLPQADTPDGIAEREDALRVVLEAQTARFKAIVEPMRIEDLKKRIREFSASK